jgi:GNAT superfamily N-acetyltransferase
VEIREAHEDDWPNIYPIFRSTIEDGRTYAFPEGLSLEEARPLWMETPPAVTVVAVENEIVFGSAKIGPNRPGRGSHIATASFMVDPAKQGRGVGMALGSYAIEWARSRGYIGMQFNAVVETNESAVHLWQKLGFEILTTVPRAFNHSEYGLTGLHVMFKSL